MKSEKLKMGPYCIFVSLWPRAGEAGQCEWRKVMSRMVAKVGLRSHATRRILAK